VFSCVFSFLFTDDVASRSHFLLSPVLFLLSQPLCTDYLSCERDPLLFSCSLRVVCLRSFFFVPLSRTLCPWSDRPGTVFLYSPVLSEWPRDVVLTPFFSPFLFSVSGYVNRRVEVATFLAAETSPCPHSGPVLFFLFRDLRWDSAHLFRSTSIQGTSQVQRGFTFEHVSFFSWFRIAVGEVHPVPSAVSYWFSPFLLPPFQEGGQAFLLSQPDFCVQEPEIFLLTSPIR